MQSDPPTEPALRGRTIDPQSAENPGSVPQAGWVDSRSLEPGAIRHGQCGKWWTGASNGHCGACHKTFTRGAFDAHQRISRGVITCSTTGLAPHPRPWGLLWSLPSTGYWAARRRASSDAGADQ